MKKIICAILILGLAASSSATIINIPADYPTIQAGIAYSSHGDTVLVQPGLYYEIIDYMGHNVKVGSLFLTTGDTSYISSTIIDGVSFGPVITFTSGEDSTAILTGFTIQNGYKDNGAGIRCMFSSSPIIKNNLITNNSGYRNCGGIYCLNGSNPIIEHNRIEGNFTNLMGGGIYSIRSAPVIKDNIIRVNTAFRGGGIYIDDCPGFVISGNLIKQNYGGAIVCNGSDIILINNEINSNDTQGDGGGVYFYESDPLVIGNEIVYNNCRYFGGGIYLGYSNAFLLNNIVLSNYAKNHGGGISAAQSEIILINCIIACNSIEGSFASGGGIYLLRSESHLANLIVRGNLDNDTLSQITLFDCNTEPVYCNIEGGWPGAGNIDLDPLFRDPANGDFHLMSITCGDSADSPCIDAGDPNILDSLLDCSWGLGGPRSDMGAYGGGDSLITGIFDNIPSMPDRIMLLQNYPNPFNAQTTIRFILPEPQDVELTIYDLLGRQVKVLVDEYMQAGVHSIRFDAYDYPSGVYFARLETNNATKSIKMLLLK